MKDLIFKTIVLTPIKFSNRLNKIILAAHHTWVLFDYHNQKEVLLKGRMNNFKDFLVNDIPMTLEQIEQTSGLSIEQNLLNVESSIRNEIDGYLPILFNQSFVGVITLFDVFLGNSLKMAIKREPKLLNQLANSEKDITISQFLNDRSYEITLENITNKVLKTFDFKSIEEKLGLLQKIGVNVADALDFKMQKPEVKTKHPEAKKELFTYYKQRHEIVHQYKHFIKTINELETIGELFNSLFISFGLVIGNHFGIKTDLEIMLSGNMTSFQLIMKDDTI